MPIKYKDQTSRQKAKYAKTAKKYREEHHEEIAVYKKEHRKLNRDKINAYNRAKRKVGVGITPIFRKVFDFETQTTKKVYE